MYIYIYVYIHVYNGSVGGLRSPARALEGVQCGSSRVAAAIGA